MMRRSIGNAGGNSSWKEPQLIRFAQIFPNLVRAVSLSNELYIQPKNWDNIFSCLPAPFPFPPHLPAREQRGKGPPCKLTWNTHHTSLLSVSTMVNTKWIIENPDPSVLPNNGKRKFSWLKDTSFLTLLSCRNWMFACSLTQWWKLLFKYSGVKETEVWISRPSLGKLASQMTRRNYEEMCMTHGIIEILVRRDL